MLNRILGSGLLTLRTSPVRPTSSVALGGSVTVIPTVPPTTNDTPFQVVVTFSEAMTGFTAADLALGNATADNLATSDNIVFTVDITPLSNGLVSVQVPVSVATSTANDAPNLASEVVNVTYDGLAPSGYNVAWTTDPITDDNVSAAAFDLTGAELGTTYNYSITSAGGGTPLTGTGLVLTASTSFTDLDLTGLGPGVVTVSLTLTDPVGNEGDPVTDNVTRPATSFAEQVEATEPSSLIHFWKVDEAAAVANSTDSGDGFADSAGSANLYPTVSFGDSSFNFQVGGVGALDSVVTTAAATQPNWRGTTGVGTSFPSAFTFMGIFKADFNPVVLHWYDPSDSNRGSVRLRTNTAGVIFDATNDAGTTTTLAFGAGGSPTDEEWHIIFGVYDGDGGNAVWIDGVETTTQQANLTGTYTPDTIANGAGASLEGFGPSAIWNTALSGAQIEAISSAAGAI